MIQVAALQLSSQDQIDDNLAHTVQLLAQAAAQGATLAVLPENFACFAAGQQQQTAARFDEIVQQVSQMAQQQQLWIVAGTLPCPYRPDGRPVPDGRVRACSLLFDPAGRVVTRYDKIHLFDAQVADGTGRYCESATFEAGNQLSVAQTPFGHVGLMVCYDLRFAEFALALRQQGANILTAPAAFTHRTGQQHWRLLLQARAIDTQCLLIGAAQDGWHGTRQTWGHSAIVDSSGQVLAEQTVAGSGVVMACYDDALQAATRAAMPLMDHRRFLLPTALN